MKIVVNCEGCKESFYWTHNCNECYHKKEVRDTNEDK